MIVGSKFHVGPSKTTTCRRFTIHHSMHQVALWSIFALVCLVVEAHALWLECNYVYIDVWDVCVIVNSLKTGNVHFRGT